MSDYYSILGVAKNASQEDIKRAYRNLAMKHHPDRNGGDDTQFKEIQTAYGVLSDPQKKSQYDAMQSGAPQGFRFTVNGQDVHNQFHFGNIDDIFRNFGFAFGNDPFNPFGHRHVRRNNDLRVQISVPLASTLAEQTKVISVQTSTGHRETVEVQIPIGVSSETTIKYPGLGDNMFSDIERGDLYVHIIVEHHPNFQIAGIDLITELNLDCLTAIVGGVATIEGLDGKTFNLNIPRGAAHGSAFRLDRQGLFAINSSTRGNLIVKINLTVPQNLTEAELEQIRQIRDSKTTV